MSSELLQFTPTKCIVGNTYKELYVRGYTVNELLTLAKISELERVLDIDIPQLKDYISRVFKTQDGYTINDIYLIDIKVGLILANILTQQDYGFSVRTYCEKVTELVNDEEVTTGCDQQFTTELKVRQYAVGNEGLVASADISGYKIGPITFGDYIDSLEYAKSFAPGTYDTTERIKALVASLLKVEGKTFKDKIALLDTEIPASVMLEIYNNEYSDKMDIQPQPIEVKCTHCGKAKLIEPPFSLKDLLPSL